LQASDTPILDLKAGDVLARIRKAEVQDKMHFPFEVAFGEPEILKGQPIIVFLHQAAHRIRNIVSEFDRLGALY
jgi:hypothetical protein